MTRMETSETALLDALKLFSESLSVPFDAQAPHTHAHTEPFLILVLVLEFSAAYRLRFDSIGSFIMIGELIGEQISRSSCEQLAKLVIFSLTQPRADPSKLTRFTGV